MTRLKYVLAALIVALSATAFAGSDDDDWDCTETAHLKHTNLQCVSCGIQKYFRGRSPSREVVPSERWILLLGLVAKQTSNLALHADHKQERSGVVDFDDRANMQRLVFNKIRSYGFCTKYDPTGSNKQGKDWSDYVYDYTNRKEAPKDVLNTIAQSFGFSDSGWGNHADENMLYLVNNIPKRLNEYSSGDQIPTEFRDQSVPERTSSFAKRLRNTLDSQYDVAGEKVSSKTFIASSEDGKGLRTCLDQIDQLHKGTTVADPSMGNFLRSEDEGSKLCITMAKECGLTESACGPVIVKAPPGKNPPSPPSAPPSRPLPPPAPAAGAGAIK